MPKITIRQPAGENERFAPGAFDQQVGETILFHAGPKTTTAQLVAAKVADDGMSAELTLAVDDAVISPLDLGRPVPNA